MRGAVEVRPKRHAVFAHLAHRGKAEHLVPAAVGEDRPWPADECVQAARARDQRVTGTKVQVVRVPQDDLRAEVFQITVRDRLHGAARPHRHERWRLHDAMGGRQNSAAGGPVSRADCEPE